jgi:hypothetical protein
VIFCEIEVGSMSLRKDFSTSSNSFHTLVVSEIKNGTGFPGAIERED